MHTERKEVGNQTLKHNIHCVFIQLQFPQNLDGNWNSFGTSFLRKFIQVISKLDSCEVL